VLNQKLRSCIFKVRLDSRKVMFRFDELSVAGFRFGSVDVFACQTGKLKGIILEFGV
jgi:hypothetical protein